MSDSASSVPGTAPGERLRVERERRGFSTQKVAEDLHVDVWVVEALEGGRHSSLGPPVYVKGHLRQYAALLGLDGEALVSAACPEQADPPLVRLRAATRTRAPLRLPLKPLLFAACALAAIAAAVWGYRVWSQRVPPAAGAQTAKQAAEAPTAGEAALAGEGSPAAAAVVERAAVSQPPGVGAPQPARAAATTGPAAAQASAPVQQRMRLRLSFSADSWVEVYDANQRRVFFDLGVANSVRSVTVAAPARVFLGYADAVQVELDGRPVALGEEVRRDNVAHFTIDARGRLAAAGSLTGR